MKRIALVVALALAAVAASADELTVSTILTSLKAGASPEGLVAVITDPANTVAIKSEDFETLRAAGVPEPVLAAIGRRLAAAPAPPEPPAAEPVRPDDSRLPEIARLSKAGISEAIIIDQIRTSGAAYQLSVNDLLFLKQEGVQDSIIATLLASKANAKPQPPREIVFNDLLLVRGLLKKDRPGRLVLDGETLSWIDGVDPKENFELSVRGLEKIWFTCQAQTGGEVCYQINLRAVRGARYSFGDVGRETGSTEHVAAVMKALRDRFPNAPYGANAH
jgi:hypothetical protein